MNDPPSNHSAAMIYPTSPNRPTRRELLKAGAIAAAFGPLVGAAPPADDTAAMQTSGKTEPRHPGNGPSARAEGAKNMHLSLAAYSVREALDGGEMDLFDFIEWCAELGLPGAELTSYYFPDEFDNAYLHELKRRAFMNGVTVSGTAVRNDFCLPPGPERSEHVEHVKRWVDHATEFYAPHIRIFAGNLPEGVEKATGIQWVADAILEALEHAAARGVILGLENHGGITARADDHLAIVEAVGDHPWFGVNLDTANYRTNAYEELAMAAPYAVNVQVKARIHREDGTAEPTDLERVRNILVEADYKGWIVLEYESENPHERIPEVLDRMKRLF